MPHDLRKRSALRVRAVVNKFILAHTDFRYSGDSGQNMDGARALDTLYIIIGAAYASVVPTTLFWERD